MNMIKGAMLGVAAGLTFSAGVQAADLPSRKAAPVAYVKICDVYGRGFYYIPGTNTCLRVGGRIRFVLAYRPASNIWVHGRGNGTFVAGRTSDTIGWRSRAYINMDARTQTAWGTVQTVISVAIRSRSGVFGGSGNGPQGQTTASPQVYAAYIRFAGFTVGRARGNFYFMPSRMFEPQYYASSSTGEVQLAYTAVFGNGFSATIALEDRTDFGYNQRANRINFAGGGVTPGAATFPNREVVVIGNLRVDQGWGRAQIMAAYVPNNLLTTQAGNPQPFISIKKTGWAIGAGLTINLPMLARGDRIHFMAAYANGALDFTHSRYPNGNTSHGRLMGGMRVQYSNVVLYSPAANVVRGASPTSWSIAAIFEHRWTSTLRSNFAASYLNVRADSISRTQNWYTAGGLRGTRAYALGANLIWTPTRGFVIGIEVGYRKVMNQLSAVGPAYGTAAAPNTVGVKKDPSMFFGRLRVQRTF
ncbi:MAG: porin [Hyphomicrobiales bacterium]|nr:porin [Hyphomicrobiales bacterium]